MINIIRNVFIALTGIYSVQPFNLLPYHNVSKSEINFYFCDDISPVLEEVSKDVINQLNTYELFKLKLNEETKIEHKFNDKNSICNTHLEWGNFGYCSHYSPFFNETDITISNTILGIGTNLYNTVLHEFVHALGLDHSNTTMGIMNFEIHTTNNKGIIKDKNKLYLSVDDYNGIKYLYDKITNSNQDEERNENNCDKNIIIEFINNCVN